MVKKLLFVFLIGMFALSACKSAATETPGAEPTLKVVQPTEESAPVEIGTGELMPCATVFDYATTAETAQYQLVVDQQPPVTDEDWIYGNRDAPITIVEYEDFQCPACPGFSLGVKDLIADFPDSIRVVFRHLPLPSIHDKAYISAMAAEAAGAQGKFWEMHDILYINQQAWTGMTEDDFVDWVTTQAETLGLDLDQFEEDMFDKDARAELEATTQERLSGGLNYTPFVVINDRIWRDNNPNLFGLIGIYEFGGFETCPAWVIDEGRTYQARLDTSAGEIVIDLFADVAPLAVNSFVFLAQNGWYEDVYFHRVVEGFVAQAGDPSGFGVVGPGYTFANETANDLTYDRAGVLGMANSGVDTNGSQFFITLAPATMLDGGYTIFGEVTEESLAVLEEIALRDPQTAVDFEGATQIFGIEIIEN